MTPAAQAKRRRDIERALIFEEIILEIAEHDREHNREHDAIDRARVALARRRVEKIRRELTR